MLSRSLRLVGSIFPFIFGALSLAFIITAFCTRDWARQDHYDPRLKAPSWSEPIYTTYRSPFVVCSVNATHPTVNATEYDINCYRYRPYGFGRTSCQVPNETSGYTRVTGDYRMCQQIHFAGNLMIAALVFICVAFATILPLSYYFVTKAVMSEERAEEAEAARATGDKPENRLHQHHRRYQRHSPIITAVLYSLILSLAIAAMCTLLAQFYGILGLIQSAPDNGIFASYNMGAAANVQLSGDVGHAPWVQGHGLSIYTSLGWLCGAFAAGAIGVAWL